MNRTAYIETTVIGYLAMRSSRDVRVAANQLSTREWWDNHRPKFDLFVSQFVVDECDQGDPSAADERRVFLENIPVLDTNSDVEEFADQLSTALQNFREGSYRRLSYFHRGRSWNTISIDLELQAHC